MAGSINTLMGLKFVVNDELDNVPRVQLKHDFAKLMPTTFVQTYDTWLREFFGTESVMYATDSGRTVVLGPKAYAQIKASHHA